MQSAGCYRQEDARARRLAQMVNDPLVLQKPQRMPQNLGSDNVARNGNVPSLFHAPYWFGSGSDGDSDPAERFPRPTPTTREDLPFKVEVWDDAFEAVEQVLAITADGTIGFGAYHAAVQELPGRNITLRYKNRVVARAYARGH